VLSRPNTKIAHIMRPNKPFIYVLLVSISAGAYLDLPNIPVNGTVFTIRLNAPTISSSQIAITSPAVPTSSGLRMPD
jgi:hypothetical protein